MHVKEEKIENIKPYEQNPRNNDAAVAHVAASIRDFGFKQPKGISTATMTTCANRVRHLSGGGGTECTCPQCGFTFEV